MRDHEWDIKPRAEACTACQQPFQDKQPFFSRLTFGAEGYDRGDFCTACWEKQPGQDALSVWRGVFRPPPPPPEEPLKKETAESLLRQMVEKDDPASRNTIYILAVMLERRRILAERDVQVREDGVKVRVYEHKATGDVFLIPDPGLRLAELERVQAEVVTMLGGKPRAAREPPQPAPEDEEDDEDEDQDEDQDEDEGEDLEEESDDEEEDEDEYEDKEDDDDENEDEDED